MEQHEVFRDVIARLEGSGIPYMLTGAAAGTYYGIPRYTRDLDFIVSIESEDVDRVLDLFGPDYYVSRTAIEEAILRRSLFNLIHRRLVIKVDFIVQRKDKYGRVAFDRRTRARLDDREFSVATPEDLILSKLLWYAGSNSEQQKLDIQNILRGCPELDWSYLNEWAERLAVKWEIDNIWR